MMSSEHFLYLLDLSETYLFSKDTATLPLLSNGVSYF